MPVTEAQVKILRTLLTNFIGVKRGDKRTIIVNDIERHFTITEVRVSFIKEDISVKFEELQRAVNEPLYTWSVALEFWEPFPTELRTDRFIKELETQTGRTARIPYPHNLVEFEQVIGDVSLSDLFTHEEQRVHRKADLELGMLRACSWIMTTLHKMQTGNRMYCYGACGRIGDEN